MFTALLICSDEDCPEVGAFVGSLEAAEDVLCEDCGCLMQVVGVEEPHHAGVGLGLREAPCQAQHRHRGRVRDRAVRGHRLNLVAREPAHP